MINLGATRQEYYVGLLIIYITWAFLFTALNVIWYQVEEHFINNFQGTFNILDIFHWNRHGLPGTLLYQFGTYMLLISLLSMLCSGLRHYAGWILWVVLIAAIPIGTSIPYLRRHVADGLTALLFNSSLPAGVGLTWGLSALFLLGGWLFTSRREF